MPIATIRLEPWSDLKRSEFVVTFDPATITAMPSDAGCLLQISLEISPNTYLSTDPQLVAVHGMASFAHQDARAGVIIPMQSLHANHRLLGIPLSTADLARIEARRAFGEVVCSINLNGLANIAFSPHTGYTGHPQALVTVPVHSNLAASFTIGREQWLLILKRAQHDSRRLVELPDLAGPAGPAWATCNVLLERATAQQRAGEAEPAIATCRQVLEGLVTVVAKHWGVARDSSQTMPNWLKELAGRLSNAWPEDEDAARVLTSLYATVWAWTSESHHYHSKVPLHEEAAFAVALTADLLTHAGHLLAAHPEPLKIATVEVTSSR